VLLGVTAGPKVIAWPPPARCGHRSADTPRRLAGRRPRSSLTGEPSAL